MGTSRLHPGAVAVVQVPASWIAVTWAPSWEQLVHSWLPEWLSYSPHAGPASPSWAWFDPAWISPAALAAVLFAIPAVVLLAMAFRPAVEIHDRFLKVGDNQIPWPYVRRVDQTGWNIPLAVYVTIQSEAAGGRRFLLLHAGDTNSCSRLLRYLRRYAREALLDGIPYRDFWGEASAPPPKQLAAPRYQLLLPEEEEEVERMFQRLKTVGHLDQRGSDEK